MWTSKTSMAEVNGVSPRRREWDYQPQLSPLIYRSESRVTGPGSSDSISLRDDISPDGKGRLYNSKSRILRPPSRTLTASRIHHYLKPRRTGISSRAETSLDGPPEAEPTTREGGLGIVEAKCKQEQREDGGGSGTRTRAHVSSGRRNPCQTRFNFRESGGERKCRNSSS